MLQNQPKKKTLLFLFMLLVAGVSSANVRMLDHIDPNCNEYEADGSCCKCSYRYYYNKNTKLCTQVDNNCATWDDKTGACLTCYPSYGSPVNGVCSSTPTTTTPTPPIGNGVCDQNCQNHSDDRQCIKCYAGYKLDSNCKCIKIVVTPPPVVTPPTIDNCAKYTYSDSNGKYYTKWIAGCKTVCVECNYGYYLTKEANCIALPENCKAANFYGACTECAQGYEISNGYCVKPVVSTPPTDNCAEYGYVDVKGKWWNSWVTGCKKVCRSCNGGYYLDKNYNCVALPDNCKAADVYGKCTECDSGYKVTSTGTCEKIVVTTPPPADNCAEYGYVDAKGKYWTKWVYGCKKVCIKCKTGYYLNVHNTCSGLPAYCNAADIYGKCTDCDSGYKVSSTGTCEKIVVTTPPPTNDNCAVYGYVDANGKYWAKHIAGCKKVCKQCKQGYELCDGVCVPVEVGQVDPNPYCVEKNDDGDCCRCAYRTVMNSEGICIPVSDYCQDWNKKTGDCTCCYGGYKLVKGDCIVA